MQKLHLGNQISIVLDLEGGEVPGWLIEYLIWLEVSQFPYFLKAIYLVNADIPRLLEDTSTRDLLKLPDFRDVVFVLPEQYQEVLFNHIQISTALSEYGGDLDE